jgi:hypothetical protein
MSAVIYAVAGSDSSNVPLCLVGRAIGKIVTWTISEANIGLTLAQLVRTEEGMKS